MSLWIILFAAIIVGESNAQETLSLSPDVTLTVGAGNLVTADENVVSDDSFGGIALENLGSLPDTSEVIAFGIAANGDRLFALDTTTELAGSVVARPGDVLRFDGSIYSVEFNAAASGIPSGVRTDALSSSATGVVLSFDTTVALPGGLTVADEDLVRWTGSSFTLALDGDTVGIGRELDIDAAQDRGAGSFALSFDSSGSIDGIDFDDEDILEFDGSAWSLLVDGSAQDADWQAADANAVFVPEPSTAIAMLAGALSLVSLRRRRLRP